MKSGASRLRRSCTMVVPLSPGSLRSMPRIPLARLSTVAFAIAFGVLIVVCVLALRGQHRAEEASRSVLHAREVLEQSELLHRLLVEAEANSLGYVIVGEKSFLDPYEGAR